MLHVTLSLASSMFVCSYVCVQCWLTQDSNINGTHPRAHTHTHTHHNTFVRKCLFWWHSTNKGKETERHFASSCCSFSSSLPPPATHLPLTYRPSHIPPHFTAVSRTLRLCTCIVASCVCLIGIVIVIVIKSTCGSLSVPRAKAT